MFSRGLSSIFNVAILSFCLWCREPCPRSDFRRGFPLRTQCYQCWVEYMFSGRFGLYLFETSRSPVAVSALYAFNVTHLLGFQSSSTSTSAFLLRSCASGSRDQSPSSSHFPSGDCFE